MRAPRLHGALAAAGVSALVAGCGDAVTSASWAEGHPNTALIAFDSTAPGLCTFAVRYPQEAPAAINYLGSIHVQVARLGHAGHAAADRVIDHSGDWEIDQRADGELLLLTPAATYAYRPESSC